MKTTCFFILSAILATAMICMTPAWCDPPVAGDRQASYESFIDEQIRHGEFKSTLGSATSPNLQKSAEVSREKVEFLKRNREALISNMEVDNVDKKPYKMSRYLNQRFYGSFRGEGPMSGTVAIEAYEEPQGRVSYQSYIDEQIRHGEFKSTLGSATSPNLQKSAEVSREKVEFLKRNREALITNMAADNVDKKPYKMSRYLNQRFYNSFRGEGSMFGAASIEAYEEPHR